MIGSTVKGYVIQELIGIGTFGSVYRAFQPLIQREVAIKSIGSSHINRTEFVRHFEIEARIIASLESLHIVPIYDFWREPESAFLVMRWLRGGSLAKVIQQGALPLEYVTTVCEQVAMALYVAHRNGVIHCDVKPENILLDEDRNAFLADFGIAREIANIHLSDDESFFGTPSYMAPEQFEGMTPTPQLDVYSLGVVLFEMLTGQRPFQHSQVSELYLMHHSQPVPLDLLRENNVPSSLFPVLERAMAKDHVDRHENVLRLAAEFRDATLSSTLMLGNTSAHAHTDDSSSTVICSQTPLSSPVISYLRGSYTPVEKPSFARTTSISPQVVLTNTNTIMMDATDSVRMPTLIVNPYKGLLAFQEIDAPDFYGRESVIESLLERITHERMIAIVGASGSGKSSVVYAGVLPRLRQRCPSAFISAMTPGVVPFRELSALLLRVSTRSLDDLESGLRADSGAFTTLVNTLLPDADSELIVFIDQFEEVFAPSVNADERERWLHSLHHAATAPDSRIRLVLTVRSDFYNQFLLVPEFGELLVSATAILLPLQLHEMERAIVEPAERAGLVLERGLAPTVLADVENQHSALPLLQFAMSEVFARRDGRTLTLQAYRESGGVRSALTTSAESTYQQLTLKEQQIAQPLFLRLINIDDQATETRRRVLWSELMRISPDDATVQAVLNRFVAQRLLSLDHDPLTREPTVEIAHEALISQWDTLHDWIALNRDDLRMERRLALTAHDWHAHDRDNSYLATGTRLSAFHDLSLKPSVMLTPEQRQFIENSMLQHRQRTRQRHAIMIALVLFSLVSLTAGAIALIQRDRADTQTRVAQSREVATTALLNQPQTDVALLLSLEALSIADTFEARNSLLTTLQSQPHLIAQISQHDDWVTAVATSPDGRWWASADRAGTIRVWDAVTRAPYGTPLTGHSDSIWSIAFSPDSTALVSASADGSAIVWDVATGTMRFPPVMVQNDGIWRIVFSPDGEQFAVGALDGTISLWDAATAQPLREAWTAHDDTVYALAFSPDGSTLYSGGGDNALRAWDVTTAELLREQTNAHDNWIFDLSVSADGLTLASASADNTIRLWNTATLTALNEPLRGHSNWVRSLAFTPDGSGLISASADGSVRLWQVADGSPSRTIFTRPDAGIWSIALAPDGQTLLTGDTTQRVMLWSLAETPTYGRAFTPAQTAILALTVDSTGEQIAASGGTPTTDSDNTIALWDTATGMITTHLSGHLAPVTALMFTDTDTLASASLDGTIRFWNTQTGQALGEPLDAHDGRIYAAAYVEATTLLVTGGDGGLMLWDARTRAQRRTIALPDTVHTLAISPLDARLVAESGTDGTIQMWDAFSGDAVGLPLTSDDGRVTALAFSSDGRWLVAGMKDGRILVWDAETQTLAQQWTAHERDVLAVQFSPDGKTIASASADQQVMLWDSATGRRLASALTAHADWVNALRFAPDGQTLFSGSMDGGLLAWQVGLNEWMTRACAITRRNFTVEEWGVYLAEMPFRELCSSSTLLSLSS